MKSLKLPNSYGSVYKLSGRRRKPWVARKTVGWKQIPDKKTAQPIYLFIGYYTSRAEALQALANYNENPYDIKQKTITFAEIYERWSTKHYETIKRPNGYKSAYKLCTSLYNMPFVDIKLSHLQQVVDTSGKNRPTLRYLKNLLSCMWEYAIMHEIINPDKRDLIKYVDISQAGNPNKKNREPFSKEAIETLWAHKDNEYVTIILILIYTGCRIGELLELKKEDIHLDERWFYVKEAKTQAGIREVPIAEKIVPFFELWLSKPCEYLLCSPTHEPFLYRNYYDSYWKPMIKELSLPRLTPHCTRHTCISLLTEALVDERIIQKIVGHKGQSITQIVYTHIDLPYKLEAINKI